MGVKEIVVKMRNYLCECEDNSCDIDSEIYSCQIDQLEAEIERDGELLGGGKYKKSCALAWDRYKATAIVVEEINKHLGHGEPPEISTIEYWKDKLLLKR